jgi:hypothetical protein
MNEEEKGKSMDNNALRSGSPRLREAAARLERYRQGKRRLDARLYEEARWWQSRHESSPGEGDTRRSARPVSAWLFNSICGKHADLCDRMPTCTALPREPGDREEAALLSDVLPVVAERCRLRQTYSDNAWTKLRHGTAVYGVFWNPTLENGIGDIDIRRVDIMNLFWEPGVTDIQNSPHLYLVGLEDRASLERRYPILAEAARQGRLNPDGGPGAGGSLPESGGSYLLRDREGCPEKYTVTDWYYRKVMPDGRTVLHYAKFVGDILLYASENDPALAQRGWYDHGLYPFVTDVLFPETDSPAGYGLIAVGRNPQGYIDELDGHILEYANWACRVRYWAKRSLGVNEKEFLDPDRRIIQVEGDMDEEKLRQITLSPMDGMLSEVRQMKIEELKETTGTRDVNQGMSGGVTAASAITALQEAGDKSSRDCIAGSYRAYVAVMEQVVELIRQFYTGTRCFRIAGGGEAKFIRYSNRGLRDRETGTDASGRQLLRRPMFDIEVRAERENPTDRAGRNELMLSLFQAGLFDPDRRHAAAMALSGMDFDGIDMLRAAVSAAGTASE